ARLPPVAGHRGGDRGHPRAGPRCGRAARLGGHRGRRRTARGVPVVRAGVLRPGQRGLPGLGRGQPRPGQVRRMAGFARVRGGGMTENWSADEMMSVAAARALTGRRVCFVGIGQPSMAANLARRLHSPDLCLIYESGPIGAKPTVPPLSIGDGELAETADAVVSVPEIFNYWLQAGRIDVGFLGAAQLDRFANINTTVVGPDYRRPKTRL